MEKSDEILLGLKKIVDVWVDEADEGAWAAGGSVEYALALDRCSIEIIEFILKNIQDIRLIRP